MPFLLFNRASAAARVMAGVRVMGVLALLACALVPGAAFAQAPDKVRVLVATKDTTKPLQVVYLTKGAVVRGALLPFGNIGNAIAYDVRNDNYNKTIGAFDRRPTLLAAMRKAFETKYPVFEIVDDGATFANDGEGKAIIARAKEQGIRYVLMVDDNFAGLTSGGYASEGHEVSVASAIRYELFDSTKGQRLAKDKMVASSLKRVALEQALTDRALLVEQMPTVHEALATLLVGSLVRSDQLHGMAESGGFGDKVPALGVVLARYEKPVRIEIKSQQGWKTLKFNTRYAMSTEPKSELRFKIGVRADVDLLIPEFGQDVDTIEQYQQAAFVRLAEAGFDPSTVQERSELTKDGFTGISIRNPTTGGGQLILFKKLDEQYIAIVTVILIEDFEGLLAAHKPALQAAIDGVDVRIQKK